MDIQRKRRRSERLWAETLLKRNRLWTDVELEEMLTTVDTVLEELELLFDLSLEFSNTDDNALLRLKFDHLADLVSKDHHHSSVHQLRSMCQDLLIIFNSLYLNHYQHFEQLELHLYLHGCNDRIRPLVRRVSSFS